jgi:hypothetical protein
VYTGIELLAGDERRVVPTVTLTLTGDDYDDDDDCNSHDNVSMMMMMLLIKSVMNMMICLLSFCCTIMISCYHDTVMILS